MRPILIAERYEDRGLIGRGGMGEVRRVYDRHLDRLLAMKILPRRLSDDESPQQRFLAEARITARLQHPSIVAVHDRGQLEDGRLWFTMREVRGRTMSEVIKDLHGAVDQRRWPTEGEVTLHRVVDAFRRLAEGIAYAHSRGVVHRDIKPSNLMVGEFGEVQVMDWGLAKEIGDVDEPTDRPPSMNSDLTQDGDVIGTPAYMSPEQAAGNVEALSARADVWSLGACLRTVLTGRPPVSGPSPVVLTAILMGSIDPIAHAIGPDHPPLPPKLVAICERAMALRSADRYADAGALAAELGGWLEGVRRRERALEIVTEATDLEPRIARLRTRGEERRAAAAAQLAALDFGAPATDKHAAWELEDEAAALEREAALVEVEWLQRLRSALEEVADLPEAHARLARHYRARLRDAEHARDGSAAARYEALLRVHDRGEHRAFLRGDGQLSVRTDPPGAEVTVSRYVERWRRLVTEPSAELGPAPLSGARLPHGSYLLELSVPGRPPVRYPVTIERGEHWDGAPPGGEPAPVRIPTEAEIGSLLYVPEGWMISGGDPHAAESLPRRRVWVDAFLAAPHPVTNRELVAHLNVLVARGEEALAVAIAPRMSPDGPVALDRDAEGRFVLPTTDDQQWLPDRPVVGVDWFGADSYARAQGARLPNELEWEKLARGVDGRSYACGEHLEVSWANVAGAQPGGGPRRVAVGSYPTDVSPYGVADTIGNVREWCANEWRREGPELVDGRLVPDRRVRDEPGESPPPDAARAARGGAFHSVPELARAAVRYAGPPTARSALLGFRIVRDLT